MEQILPESLNSQTEVSESGNSSPVMELEGPAQRTPPAKTKRQIFTIIRKNAPYDSCQKEAEKESPEASEKKIEAKYNRKEKSLGELSKKFLMMFGRLNEDVISLDNVTVELGVERRRIYDIINILESLGVIFRRGKNNYQWKGLKSIYETLKKIQKKAATDKSVEDQAVDNSDSDDDSVGNSTNRKEKSLGLLSTGFIKLFINWNPTISLEQAAQKLSSSNPEENKIKTKIRRLYDIANVFSALGLIKKTALESRKPAFTWVGANGLDQFIRRLNSCSDEREIFAEKLPKKSLLKCLEKEKQKTEVAEKPLQIKSENSAFKPADTQSTPNSATAGKNPQSVLFDMFLEFFKQHIEGTQRKVPQTDSKPLTELKSVKLSKLSSSPAALMGKENMVTPSIKKSVSIIQKIDFNEISPDKGPAPLMERGLSDVTNCPQLIRKPDLSDLDPKPQKKLYKFNEDCHAFKPSAFLPSFKLREPPQGFSL